MWKAFPNLSLQTLKLIDLQGCHLASVETLSPLEGLQRTYPNFYLLYLDIFSGKYK